jgi:hypothetical protein
MTHFKKTLLLIAFSFFMLVFTGCDSEDPGPLQDSEKDFALVDFDRLEMGSGYNITVTEAATFGIHAEGDRRNLDDLDVHISGSTLIIRYDDNKNRKHNTYLKITMPRLNGVKFSGGTVSAITGFESDGKLDLNISGGSVCQFHAGYRQMDIDLSGGSSLRMSGLGDTIDMTVSGASKLSAFDFPISDVRLDASGASDVRITVSDNLHATASGASNVLYRGNPAVTSSTSGNSTVHQD